MNHFYVFSVSSGSGAAVTDWGYPRRSDCQRCLCSPVKAVSLFPRLQQGLCWALSVLPQACQGCSGFWAVFPGWQHLPGQVFTADIPCPRCSPLNPGTLAAPRAGGAVGKVLGSVGICRTEAVGELVPGPWMCLDEAGSVWGPTSSLLDGSWRFPDPWQQVLLLLLLVRSIS